MLMSVFTLHDSSHVCAHEHGKGRGLRRAVLQLRALADPRFLPMVCPPIPWEAVDRGGYLLWRSSVIRAKQSFQYKQARSRAPLPAGPWSPQLSTARPACLLCYGSANRAGSLLCTGL